MAKQDLPDIKTFLSDPAFQKDKDFFFGLFDAYLTAKAEAARKQQEDDDANSSLFDRMFGARK